MAASQPKLVLPCRVLTTLAEPLSRALADTPYDPPPGDSVSVKSVLQSLLPSPNSLQEETTGASDVEGNASGARTRDLCLCCAALAAAEGEESPFLYWVPKDLRRAGRAALRELSESLSLGGEAELVRSLLPEVLPLLKGTIKESCVDPEADDIVASSAKSPVVYAIMAAHEFRWLVTQVTYPYLGKLCSLVIPCALTTLDHWSPEVKGPGMVTFIHLAKNVNSAELGWYGDPILDICSRNIASSEELWDHVVEMSVLLLTCIERGNPRSPWCEQILSEMLGHLERQPEIKKQRVAWLLHIEPVLNSMGLLLLAHFRRIFLLLFQWLHAEDDETIILVLERVHTIVKITWVRKSPFILRLIDELTLVYKEAAMKKEREAIRSRIGQIIVLLQKCHGTQLEAAWEKHRGDPDLAALTSLHCSSSGALPR